MVRLFDFQGYVDPNATNDNALTSVLAAIAANSGVPAGTVIDGSGYSSAGNAAYPFTGFFTPGNNGTAPKAYLNYLVFDRDFNMKDYGFRQVSTSARETGDLTNHTGLAYEGGSHEKLAFENTGSIKIKEAGYVYIWLSNEETTPVEVFFDDFKVTHVKSPVIQTDDYYPFGLRFNSYARENSMPNKIKLFQGQEHIDDLGLNWDSFKWRNHMPDIGRFFNVDPLSSKYVYNSPYAFSENHVIVHVELEGLEKVYVFDKSTRPQDNGTPGTSYTATVYVEHENGNVAGPYSGSSYPNSKSNTDNSTNSNTVNEGEHQFNNASGHSKGTKQGLNLINATGQRQSPGTDPDGNSVTMSVVNVHEGTSNNGNATSRGSEGCITIAPADASNFFANFDWSGSTGKTGNSTGSVVVRRNEGIDKIHDEVHLMILKEAAQAEQKAVAPEPEQIENK